MYHEIEGILGMKPLIFDDEELVVGEKHYPYSEIESLEITSAPLFATYGILNLRTHDKDVAIPFARGRKNKLMRALKELEQLRKSGQSEAAGQLQDSQSAIPAAGQDPYEELKKLKELLDLGIITQEEFDTKKKQLLDL